MSLNESNKNSSSPIFTLLLIIIISGGLFYIYKTKCQKFDLTRLSLESQDSITSNESIENEDDY